MSESSNTTGTTVPCPVCEGKGITGQIAYGEDQKTICLFGRDIPVVAVLDRQCSVCKGEGRVTAIALKLLAIGKRPPQSTKECRKCSVCKGSSHHWLYTATEARPQGWFFCKHCPAIGEVCGACIGDGCEDCDGEGAIEIEAKFCRECGAHHQDDQPCPDVDDGSQPT